MKLSNDGASNGADNQLLPDSSWQFSTPPLPFGPRDWMIWQLVDSSFPSGGFAHSGGLEAAWQQGEVRSREALADFIRVNLMQMGWTMLPFANQAHQHPGQLSEWDALCDAFVSNHVANRASRAQGRAFLMAATHAFARESLQELSATVAKGTGHYAPVFGATLARLDIPNHSALRLFLFLALRGFIAGAVRLGIIGPLEAQNLQFQLTAHTDFVLTQCGKLGVNEAAQTAPILDILHGAHDRLYSRLFQS